MDKEKFCHKHFIELLNLFGLKPKEIEDAYYEKVKGETDKEIKKKVGSVNDSVISSIRSGTRNFTQKFIKSKNYRECFALALSEMFEELSVVKKPDVIDYLNKFSFGKRKEFNEADLADLKNFFSFSLPICR